MIWTVLLENRWYFLGFGLLLLGGGALLLAIDAGQELIWFAERRSATLDAFFRGVTQMGEEWAFLYLMVLFLFYRYRYSLLVALTGMTVTLVSFLAKQLFGHHRPKAVFSELDLFDQLRMVDGIYINSGPTSFPSGHTMAAFALYTLLALLLPRKFLFGLSLLLLALAVGVSRIYLFQHFLKDVYLGAILGLLIGLGYYLLERRRWAGSAWWGSSLLKGFIKGA